MKPLSPSFNVPDDPAQPGTVPATLIEVFSPTAADGAAASFALAHVQRGARMLWVQDRGSQREGGRVASLASHGWNTASWQVTLLRSRTRPPAKWIATQDGKRLIFDTPVRAEAARAGPAPRQPRPAG